jgi:hypothetical protein
MQIFQSCLKQVQTVVGSIKQSLENERLEVKININVIPNIGYQFMLILFIFR